MMPRFFCLALAALAACARIEFNGDGDGGSGGTTATTGGGAASGDGGNAGAPQGGSPAPCEPTTETCNDIDDDCDGVADEPDAFPATAFCGCDWISFDERPYASCPTLGAPEDASCPAGMRIVVLQSMAEHDAMRELVLLPNQDGYVGLRQADGAPERDSSWQWFREGMPLPWFGTGDQEPDDYTPGAYEPIPFENDSENCGGFYNFKDDANNRGLVDSDCIDAFERVLCEPIADECIAGAPCVLDEGCEGTFDCSRPEGSRCVAAPTDEVCDGKDNDCNGEIDEDACGCTEVTEPETMRAYKLCPPEVRAIDAHCGPGFRLAILDGLSEIAFAEGLLPTGQAFWIGLYQRTTATTLTGDWQFWDEAPLSLPFWAATQPNDDNDIENGSQNCATLQASGCHDTDCTATYGWLCEEL